MHVCISLRTDTNLSYQRKFFCFVYFSYFIYRNSSIASMKFIHCNTHQNNKQKTFQFHCLTREASGIFILSVCLNEYKLKFIPFFISSSDVVRVHNMQNNTKLNRQQQQNRRNDFRTNNLLCAWFCINYPCECVHQVISISLFFWKQFIQRTKTRMVYSVDLCARLLLSCCCIWGRTLFVKVFLEFLFFSDILKEKLAFQ